MNHNPFVGVVTPTAISLGLAALQGEAQKSRPGLAITGDRARGRGRVPHGRLQRLQHRLAHRSWTGPIGTASRRSPVPERIPYARPRHVPAASASYELSGQRRADKAFYCSGPWRRLRAAFLKSNPLCLDCKKAGRVTLAVHVHHVEERKDNPSRALDWSNLEALVSSATTPSVASVARRANGKPVGMRAVAEASRPRHTGLLRNAGRGGPFFVLPGRRQDVLWHRAFFDEIPGTFSGEFSAVATRGRKPKPTAIKLLEGTRADRVNASEPRPASGYPDPPATLDEVALEEWHRLAGELEPMGVVTLADRSALETYCRAYPRRHQAQEVLDRHGPILDQSVENEAGDMIPCFKSNPAAAVVAAAEATMLRTLAAFGCDRRPARGSRSPRPRKRSTPSRRSSAGRPDAWPLRSKSTWSPRHGSGTPPTAWPSSKVAISTRPRASASAISSKGSAASRKANGPANPSSSSPGSVIS